MCVCCLLFFLVCFLFFFGLFFGFFVIYIYFLILFVLFCFWIPIGRKYQIACADRRGTSLLLWSIFDSFININ